MKNFEGKTVWITGASSGIGEAMAKEFARQGAKLVLSARDETELARVAASCSGVAPIVQPLDLGIHESLAGIVGQVLAAAGKVDILVNNAGISQRSLIRNTRFEVDRRLIDVNLLGTICLSKALLPHFLERKTGHFVVVSSLMGKFGAPLRSTYAAAKHGLHGFFEALRAECWRENVRVTMLCPGFVRTNVSRQALTGDGTPQGTMDEATEKGLSPEVFAKKALRAIFLEKEEVWIGGREVAAAWLKKFLPVLLSKILRNAKVT